jgi:hypothetical protein
MTNDYVVELHSSEGESVTYRGVAELKESGPSIYVYGPNNSLKAIIERDDIKSILPLPE